MAGGRYAPSPTADLHVGNLRTAVVAWLFARSAGSRFLMRIEDLDPSTRNGSFEHRQLDDLRALGLDWDGEPMRQSERTEAHHDAIAQLDAAGHLYRCYCSRREVREAAQAAHGPPTHYPGTCRDLSRQEQLERETNGRPAALRFRGDAGTIEFEDRIAGRSSAPVDDVVLQRNDGTPAYNLAVIVDDAEQGVEEVVRGNDLLDSTPAQIAVARALGLSEPTYAHVPLVLGPSGERLAKRDGAVTLAELSAAGRDATWLLSEIAHSLGLADAGEPVSSRELLGRFDPSAITWTTWTFDPASEVIP